MPHREEADVVTVGEAMVTFIDRQPTADDNEGESLHYPCTVIGAESNLATNLANVGHRCVWVSRLGDDAMGRRVTTTLEDGGVEVRTRIDANRPTGLAVKELEAGSRAVVRYYRAGSAASALDGSETDLLPQRARWLHLTGITPALSPTSAQAMDRYIAWAQDAGVGVSFDVNYRPVLWSDTHTAATVLGRLAQAADLVFVGDDESTALFGTSDGGELLRTLELDGDQELVVKQGPRGAQVWRVGAEPIFEPATTTEAFDATGAGDAFAAGYLAGSCRGAPSGARLRLGHLIAASALRTWDDVGIAPAKEAVLKALAS